MSEITLTQIFFLNLITLAAVFAIIYVLRRMYSIDNRMMRMEEAILRIERKFRKK
ncbi:hypothetical protein HZB88_01175 [archaeon]|nr:hypothetical protein [archaeon]